jgi:hypothetical protein
MARSVYGGAALPKIVVVLGAGASAGMGLPVLGKVFNDQAVRDYLANEARELREFMEEFIWGPRGVDIGAADSCLNIEEVLTLLREWERAAIPPINVNRNLEVQKQLLSCVHKAVYTGKGHSHPSLPLNRLVRWCDANSDQVTWATFNWDVKLEQAFWYEMESIPDKPLRLPSCHPNVLDWDGRNEKHYLLKLHGSVSWFKHEDESVHAIRFGAYSRGEKYPIDQRWEDYMSGRTGAVPLIAEPSFYKHEAIQRVALLWNQWEQFNERLSYDVDIVLVCGYSLPDGDALAKNAILTSVANNPDARWIVVNPNEEVLDKYQRLLGENRMTREPKYLSDFVDGL